MTRNWWKEAVIYQIYPRSFQDSNGDGIGDLGGILQRVDYLKELGVDAVWLSPIYSSPNDDNGYDISDYRNIMKEFGTLEEFKTLLEELHARDIKLIMDLVVNHTSDEHQWFQESRKSKDNPYRDYYIWKDPKEGKEPNNWTSYFSGPAWEYDEMTEQYFLHIFSKKMPDLNWENEKVREEIKSMMRFWLDMGVDGFRMDTANLYSKDQRFPDGNENVEIIGKEYFQDGPRIHEFFRELRKEVMDLYPGTMTVGETADVTVENAKLYTGEEREELNMVFQFEHTQIDVDHGERWTIGKYSIRELKAILSKWQTELGKTGWNSLYWTNHDQPRTVSRFGNDKKYRVESQKMLYTMLLTMQGTPYIYQGEEIGMTNAGFTSIDDYQDVEISNLWNERVVKGNADPETLMKAITYRARDNARTPMQWNAQENAGFTSGTPWLKVNSNYKNINVEESEKDSNSILNYMKKLIKLRKQYKVAVYGDFEEIYPENDELYAYTRTLGNERMLVILNFTERETTFELPKEIVFKDATGYIFNYNESPLEDTMVLKPYEAKVFLLN